MTIAELRVCGRKWKRKNEKKLFKKKGRKKLDIGVG